MKLGIFRRGSGAVFKIHLRNLCFNFVVETLEKEKYDYLNSCL